MFSSDIMKISATTNSIEMNQSIADNLKITLADMRRNVHIQGALTAMILRIKSKSKELTKSGSHRH